VIYNADAFEVLPTLEDNSVDAVITDPPYGTTRNKWDVAFDLSKFWKDLERVNKGVVVAFTAQPFTTSLIASNQSNFRYDLVWSKNKSTGHLNSKKMPLRAHESIVVFYQGTYNPQMTDGHSKMNAVGVGGVIKGSTYGKSSKTGNPGGATTRHPKSVLSFPVVNNDDPTKIHPTQKPLALVEWLIRTYTNEGDVVLDPFMGSGTTGVAAQNLNRNFIGIEKDKVYYEHAKSRMMVNV
jgi:DNA modification methylase